MSAALPGFICSKSKTDLFAGSVQSIDDLGARARPRIQACPAPPPRPAPAWPAAYPVTAPRQPARAQSSLPLPPRRAQCLIKYDDGDSEHLEPLQAPAAAPSRGGPAGSIPRRARRAEAPHPLAPAGGEAAVAPHGQLPRAVQGDARGGARPHGVALRPPAARRHACRMLVVDCDSSCQRRGAGRRAGGRRVTWAGARQAADRAGGNENDSRGRRGGQRAVAGAGCGARRGARGRRGKKHHRCMYTVP